MTAGIIFTCSINYKSSKTNYNLYTRVIDYGPHTNSILRGGGATYTRSDLYASIYGNNVSPFQLDCKVLMITKQIH